MPGIESAATVLFEASVAETYVLDVTTLLANGLTNAKRTEGATESFRCIRHANLTTVKAIRPFALLQTVQINWRKSGASSIVCVVFVVVGGGGGGSTAACICDALADDCGSSYKEFVS